MQYFYNSIPNRLEKTAGAPAPAGARILIYYNSVAHSCCVLQNQNWTNKPKLTLRRFQTSIFYHWECKNKR